MACGLYTVLFYTQFDTKVHIGYTLVHLAKIWYVYSSPTLYRLYDSLISAKNMPIFRFFDILYVDIGHLKPSIYGHCPNTT